MRNALAILAFVLAALGLGWVVIFGALASYKAYYGGLIVLEQIEGPYRIRAVLAGALGLVFLFVGLSLMRRKGARLKTNHLPPA